MPDESSDADIPLEDLPTQRQASTPSADDGREIPQTPTPSGGISRSAPAIMGTIGDYEVVDKLGQGGMGAVYRARQISLGRMVALKILPAQYEEDEDFVGRFQREARLAASLNHPNLVRVYASGLADGSHFIAMELVEGETLSRRVKRGALPQPEAVRICLDVAHALQCGWQSAQLIHRDIKPSNIYLSHSGEVKLGDLGLAKSLAGNTTGLTHTGTMMGTPHYVSPEQARGDKAIDFRTDIYSLGCTLYQCLTGQTPYVGSDPLTVMNLHLSGPPPALLKVMPGCPIPLARLVGKMLKKQRHERHQSYEELIEQMESVLALVEAGDIDTGTEVRLAMWREVGGGSSATPAPVPTAPPSGAKSKVPLYAGVVAGAVVLGAAAFFLWPKGAKPGRTQPVVQPTPAVARNVSTPAPFKPVPAGAAATYGGHRYQLVPGPLTWAEAKAKAEAMGGHLATFTSEAEERWVHEQFVAPQALSSEKTHLFSVGGFAEEGSSEFRWITGEPMGKIRWRGGNPGWRELESNASTKSYGGVRFAAGVAMGMEDKAGWFNVVPSTRSPSGGFLVEWDDAGPPATATPAPPWRKIVLTEDQLSGTRTRLGPGGEWKIAGELRLPGITARNVILRVEIQRPVDVYTNLFVRWGTEARMLSVGTKKAAVQTSLPDRQIRTHLDFAYPWDSIAPDEWTPVQLAVVGEKTWASIAGVALPRRTTPQAAEAGPLGFTGTFSVRNVELLILDGLPDTEAERIVEAAFDLDTPGGAGTAPAASPADATKDAPFVNSLGMKFVPVPITGGPTDGKRVLFGVWSVRVQDYAVFATEMKREWPKAGFEQGPTHPAVMVSWEDAQAFCAWLTERERKAGRLGANEVYRLPSDHEWSCAVGIGEQEDAGKLPSEKNEKIADEFPWGNTAWPPPERSGNYWSEELRPVMKAWTWRLTKGELPGRRDGYATTSPVGSFSANRLGIFDLGGNVWQWCEDWYATEQTSRVLRGASWLDVIRGLMRSSGRNNSSASSRRDYYGFRCVVSEMSAP